MNKNFGDIQTRLESLKSDIIDKHLQGFENLKDQYEKVKEVGEQGMAAFGLMKSSMGIKKLVNEYRNRKSGSAGTGENVDTEAGDVEAEHLADIPEIQAPALGSGTVGPQQFVGDLGEKAMKRIRSKVGQVASDMGSEAPTTSARTGEGIEMRTFGGDTGATQEDFIGGGGGDESGLRGFMRGVYQNIRGGGAKVTPVEEGTEIRGGVQDFGEMPAEVQQSAVSRVGMLKSGLQRNVSEMKGSFGGTSEDFGEIPAELQGQGVSRMGMLKSGFQRNLGEVKDAFNSTVDDVKGAANAITDSAGEIGDLSAAAGTIEEASATAAAVPGIGDVVAGIGEIAGMAVGAVGLGEELAQSGQEQATKSNLEQTISSAASRASVIPMNNNSTYSMSSLSSF